MEKYENLLKNNNISDIRNFLKNNRIELLKTIAKRYKLSVSSLKKQSIIQKIIDAIENKKQFHKEPEIQQMTIAQLKNKAIELNIDISGLKTKQDLRLAIIKKMSSPEKQTIMVQTNDTLKSKPLPYLKAIAKKYKIKISKLNKDQLIIKILEAQSGSPSIKEEPVIEKTNILMMNKNELIVYASKLDIDVSGKKKAEIIALIRAKLPDDKNYIDKITLPVSKDTFDRLMNDKTVTIPKIKKLLKRLDISIPDDVKKRNDLLLLLKSEKTIAHLEADIVPLEAIHLPYSPPTIEDLLDIPDQVKVKDELIRCLQFYEYPKEN